MNLDETLVSLPQMEGNEASDSFEVTLRPGLHEYLSQLKRGFNLILFGFSPRSAIRKVLTFIENYEEYFVAEFAKDSCVELVTMDTTHYVVDLNCLKGLNLDETLIVDSSLIHFCLQLGNGVPLLPFFGSEEDTELANLTKYLMACPKDVTLKEFTQNTLKLEEKFEEVSKSRYDEALLQKFQI